MNKKIFFFGILCAIFTSVNLELSATANQSSNLVSKSSNLIAQNNTSQSKNDYSKIIFFLGLISAGALLWYWMQSRRGSISSFTPSNHNSDTQLLDRVSPKLRRQLLRQINDPKTINRLLIGIQQNNPDRSPNWIAEKAIYDFRRGR